MPVSGTPKEIVHQEMGKFKRNQLHSGSDRGPKVTNRKQAVAIALNVARRRGRARGGYADGGFPDDAALPTDRYDTTAAPRSLAGLVAPGLTRYLTEPTPPPQITPNAAGKVPSADYNPNTVPAMQDVANLGMAAIPFGRAASMAGEALPLAARAAEAAAPRGGSAAGLRALGSMSGAVPTSAAGAPVSAPAAPPPSAVIEALGPRPVHSDDDQATVDRLNQEITALAAKRAGAIKGMGPRGAAVQAASFDTQIQQRNDQLRAIQGQLAKRQSAYDDQATQFAAEYAKKTAPFAIREPGAAAAASTAPLVSMGAGAILGGLAGNKISPLKRAATYGAAGLGGGLEGLVGGYLPTYEDLKLPPGSVGRTQAEASNEDPKFWKGSVLPEVGMSAGLGLLGAKYGMIRRAPGAAPAAAPSAPLPALAREATGNVARTSSSGKVFQDQAGRWREHGSGRFVAQPAGGGRSAGQMLNAPDAHAKGGAVAAALDIARRQGRAIGGQAPWQIRSEARGEMFSGPIRSMVAGRTDHIPLTVASGSYVLPAQHVSHLGQNNTESGFARLGHMFSTGPFGTGLPPMARGRGAPPLPHAPATSFHQGGVPGEGDHGVSIMAAGGEYVLPPHVVRMIGNGNIHHGHQVLDAWIESTKKKHATTIAKLPGPAKD